MSAPSRYAARMKLNLPSPSDLQSPISHLLSSHVASFGNARLMRKFNGDCYILGGTRDDHAAAKEWVSMFLHEAAISFPPTMASRAAA